FGIPAGAASITYSPTAQTLTVTVNASGVTPGMHAAHIHTGSCQSQGGVLYMLMDFTADSNGQIVNQTRTVAGVTTPIPANAWHPASALSPHPPRAPTKNPPKDGRPTPLPPPPPRPNPVPHPPPPAPPPPPEGEGGGAPRRNPAVPSQPKQPGRVVMAHRTQ